MARLTLGEELISQEHELIRNSLHLLIKRTYIKVTYQGGDWCICEPQEVADMTAGAEGFKTEEVLMTEAEFNALPEFQG